MASAAKESNCNTWCSTDTILCPAERALARMKNPESYDPEEKITIQRAQEEFHSFKGEMPKELTEGLTVLPGQESAYPREIYSHFENRIHCDLHGHKCLNG